MGGIVTWSINSDYPSGHPRSLHDIIYNSLTRFPSSIDLSDNFYASFKKSKILILIYILIKINYNYGSY